LWGEEKAVSGAKEDLMKKYEEIDPFVLGNIQFMFCYAANGSKIRFYAIEGYAKRPDPFVPLTEELNLTSFIDRFEVLRTVINIARVMVTVRNILPPNPYPLAKRMKHGLSEMTFNFGHVEKKLLVTDLPYSQAGLQDRLGFLKNMYEHAKQRRGLVEVMDSPR